ncbi:hypothetical protein BDV98DRAFT_574740 [Pterulicium gracile]|uniref:Polysaccharide lyase 14 domain-containing protein n=1 Tax=Pterulicium gracile TaxID=1884261 RepID=A0A5C3Q8J9_9AGAR|nr:hypothetical protein BDV98DRAFT_574740 [Pterula gracilis]
MQLQPSQDSIDVLSLFLLNHHLSPTSLLAIPFVFSNVYLLCISNQLQRIMSCHNEDEQTNGFAGGPIHLPILRNHLIPVRVFQSGFTTSTALQNAHSLIGQDGAQAAFGSQQGNLAHVSFSDAALSVHRAQSNLPHPIVKPPRPTRNHGPSSRDLPDPEHAYEAKYPKGSINPAAKIPGGFGFYLAGDNAFKKRCGDGVKEVIMSYRMMLEQGWMWAKGGKLPGMFGGEGDKAYGCSGGRKDSRCTCFDVRLMWRANGEGELYTYLPPVPSNDKVLCAIPPRSIRNNDYGYSVGRGSFNLNDAVGRWMGVALRGRCV